MNGSTAGGGTVALSPDDIVNHDFRQAIRGYAVQEVDDLLDRLADQLERAELDIADLRERVSKAEARTTEALATESSLKRTLISAQDTAQRTMDDARTHAETVRADAERQAAEQLDEATSRSTAMVQQAESEARRSRASYRVQHEATAARVAELAVIEERYRTQVRALLEHQLGEIERLEATGPAGGLEVEQLQQARPQEGDEGGDGAGDEFGDRAVAGDDGQDRVLVPFGGLTVRSRDDGDGPSDRTDTQARVDHDEPEPDREPLA
jgi:cell division initiation protein